MKSEFKSSEAAKHFTFRYSSLRDNLALRTAPEIFRVSSNYRSKVDVNHLEKNLKLSSGEKKETVNSPKTSYTWSRRLRKNVINYSQAKRKQLNSLPTTYRQRY